jgi:hypothetical protein
MEREEPRTEHRILLSSQTIEKKEGWKRSQIPSEGGNRPPYPKGHPSPSSASCWGGKLGRKEAG